MINTFQYQLLYNIANVDFKKRIYSHFEVDFKNIEVHTMKLVLIPKSNDKCSRTSNE